MTDWKLLRRCDECGHTIDYEHVERYRVCPSCGDVKKLYYEFFRLDRVYGWYTVVGRFTSAAIWYKPKTWSQVNVEFKRDKAVTGR